jgi:hypothetical protein
MAHSAACNFGGETLDYFRLAIGQENIDNPAKSGRIALSHTKGGPMFGHPTNMRPRRPGSSQNALSLEDAQFIG